MLNTHPSRLRRHKKPHAHTRALESGDTVPNRSPHRAFPRLAATLLLGGLVQAAWADELKPFEVSYTWSYHGMTVAESTLTLKHREADTWVYSSKSLPRGIGHLFPERPQMESVLRVTPSGVQPLSYKATAGTSSTRRDVNVTFDWEHQRVTGVYQDKPVDRPLQPGTQDDLSVQIALMVELLRGHSPEQFLLLDEKSARLYHYARENTETIGTPVGQVSTVIYRSQADYSPRATRFWCAPDHGYIPMRVEQKADGSVEWTMALQKLRRD
jgi:hypothetical protein